MPYAKTSLRGEQRALREKMRGLGMSHRQVATELARRHELRPRAAWRQAHGWSLTEAAKQINAYAARTGLDDGVTVSMTAAHLCEHENWPGQAEKPSGRRPTPYFLSLLAAVYGCTVHDLLDVADYRHMPPVDRLILDKTSPASGQQAGEAATLAAPAPPGQSGRLLPAMGTRPRTVDPPALEAAAASLVGEGYRFSGQSVMSPGGEIVAGADPELMSYLLNALPQHARIASMFGGSDLIPLIEKHVSFILAGCDDARGKHRESILRTCARYAEFLGWLNQDAGRRRNALFWSDRAVEWAQEADDPLFVSYVLMRKSDQAEDQEVPERVLGLALAAGRIPGLTPRARALVLQQEARGHAQNGDTPMFQRKLAEARDCVTTATDPDDAPWGRYCTHTYIAMQEATGWAELGQPGRAIAVFEREFPGMPASDQVDRAVFRARLARAYADDGSADRAARAALEAWPAACATRSGRALRELAYVRRAVDHRREEAEVAHFLTVFDARTGHAGSLPSERQAR